MWSLWLSPKMQARTIGSAPSTTLIKTSWGFHHIFSKRRLILNKYMSKSIIFIIKTHDYIGLYKHFAQIFATIVTNVDLLNTWSEIENSHEKYAWDFNRSDTWTNSCKCVYAAKHILTKRYETISVHCRLCVENLQS